MNRLAQSAAACALAVMMAACGGGGDDAGSSGFIPPSDDFNAAAAWRNLLTTGRTWSVAGIGSDGRNYQITVATTPVAATVFPVTGENTPRSDVSLATTADGVTATGLQQIWFDAATHTLIGLRNSAGTNPATCDVATVVSVLPSAVKVGASGSLATLDELDGCLASSGKIGTITITWSIEFVAATTFFCSNSTERNLANVVLATESDCLQVSPDGTLGAKARISLVQNGVSLTATN